MKINGNLTLNSDGLSQIENLQVERLASLPTAVVAEKGRLVFNTTDSIIYFNNGVGGANGWTAFATGGNATALQTELNAVESSLGTSVLGDGTFNAAAFSSAVPAWSTEPTSVTDAIVKLATYGGAHDALSELTDVALTAAANRNYLRYNGTQWVNGQIILTDVSDVTTTVSELNQLHSGTAVTADFVKLHDTTASAAELNILDGATLTTTELNFVDGVTSSVQDQLDNKQPLDATLTGLAALPDTSAVANQIAFTSDGAVFSYDAGAGARSKLGLVLGTDVQAFDADLLQIANFTPSVNDFIYCTSTTSGSRYSVASGATLRTALGLGDIAVLDDSDFIRTNGTSTLTANLTMTGYKIINLGNPTSALDAVNKTYVDNLVTSGTKWVDPVRNPDLVGITATVPASPLASGLYIAYNDGAGTGFPQTWNPGGVSVVEYDLMHFSQGNWAKSGTLANGTRLLAGVFTNALDLTSGENLTGTGISENDLVQYVGAPGSDPKSAANWSFPNGRVGGVTFAVTATNSGTKSITLAGDLTASIHGGNEVKYFSTYPTTLVGTFYVESVTFGGGNTTVYVAEAIATASGGTLEPEMRDGTTTLTNNPSDSHFGQTYLYNALGNEWAQIAGPGSVDAGIGLAYTGTTLNVNLGAGIFEGPSDAIGVDLYNPTTGALIITSDGSTRDTVTSAKLHLKTNLTQFDQDAGGLFLKASGITADELNASVAGNGLTGGAGTALAVGSHAGTGSTGGDDPANWAGVGTVTIVADGVGATLGNTSTTAAPGNHTHKAAIITTAATGVTGNAYATTLTVQGDINALDDAITAVISGSGSTISSLQTEVDAIETAVGLAIDGTYAAISGANYATAGVLKTAVGQLDTQAKAEYDARVALAAKVTNSYYTATMASSTTWTVTHGIGVKFCVVTVVDATDEVIIPQSIKFDSTSQLTVTFNAAVAGTIVVMGRATA